MDLFEKNGCEVDRTRKMVKFEPSLVEECIRKAPSVWRAKARDPKDDLMISSNTVYFCASPGMQTVDLDTWDARIPTKEEYYDGLTVIDALSTVHMMCCYTPYYGFKGIPEVMKEPEGLAARIRMSTKFGMVSCPPGAESFMIEIGKVVGMDIMGVPDASPPLTYYKDSIDVYFKFVEAGFPVKVGGGPILGGSSPVTFAGSTITNNAEIMGGIVLAQLIKPGARLVVCDCNPFPINMRSGAPDFGSIGVSIHQTMFNQIWKRYGVPTIHVSAGYPNLKRIDFQGGYERAINLFLCALSGANIIFLHGSIYGELTHHPIQSVLDDDIAGMVGRFLEGVEVNDDTLAIDLIEQVGPLPGFYLNKEHTRKWWEKEQSIRKVADTLTYPEWKESGKKSCLDYAKERMEEILKTHKVKPLPEDVDKEIDNILNKTRNYYKERDLLI